MRTYLHFIAVFTICFTALSVSAQEQQSLEINLKGETSYREYLSLTSEQAEVNICDLEIGKIYQIYFGGNYEVSQSGMVFEESFKFVAEEECILIYLQKKPEDLVDYTYPNTISVGCIECNPPPAATTKNALSLQATPNADPSYLVKDVFIGGDCFDTENFSVTGTLLSMGTFTGGTALFGSGFEEGIVLSTGYVANATGPSTNFSSDGTGGGSDPDLGLISSAGINDAAILEFDFVPTVDEVSFEYAFASEEYCDFAPPNNAAYNDVFGFFLSGPGVGTNVNIATGPGDFTVGINTVNPVTNSGFFYPNNTSDCGGGLFGPLMAYDGYTATFTAVATVIPCETYHIKLAIGDAGDAIFDSAVFLKANSFDAGGAATAEADNALFTIESNDAYESDGCGDAYFRFLREGTNFLNAVTVEYEVSGTATEGVDYSELPPSPITIPPGQPWVDIPVSVYLDDIEEGDENILLFLYGACSCDVADVELIIHDPLPITAEMPDIEICQDFPAYVGVTPTSGYVPYTFQWSTGANTPYGLLIDPTNGIEPTYTVTVTDACGSQAIESAEVSVLDLEAVIDGEALLCGVGDSTELLVNFSGASGPYDIVYSVNGGDEVGISGITDNPYVLNVNQIGDYALEVVAMSDIPSCLGSTSGTASVALREAATVAADLTDASCTGSATGSINLNISNPFGALTYNWSNGSTLEDQSGLPAGTYTVTVNDAGCELIETYTLAENTPLEAVVEGTVGVDCANPEIGEIDITPSGGAGGYTFVWSNGTTNEDLAGVAAGNYSVTVVDADNCDYILSDITVIGSVDIPFSEATQSSNLDCNNTSVTLSVGNSDTGSTIEYTWTDEEGNVIESGPNATEIEVTTDGAYTLTVLNTANGCFSAAPVNISSDTQDPVADAGATPTINCINETVQLNGTASANGDNITYAWSGPAGADITDETTNAPTVDTEGTYTLTVTNTENGCTSTATVTVEEDINDPNVAIAAPGTLDCNNETLQIDATDTDQGGFSYQWISDEGHTILGGTTLTPTVSEPGEYVLEVTNNANGCTTSMPVTVADGFNYPNIDIEDPATITCNTTSVQIDADASDTDPSYEYQWTTLSGLGTLDDPTTLSPNVDGGGTFRLRISDPASGCFSELEITVPEDTDAPAIVIDSPDVFSCETTDVSLNANVDGNISYVWTVTAGNANLSNEDTSTPVIDAPGTFEVIATNMDNGCSSAAAVTVVPDLDTPVAQIEALNQLSCAENVTTITGVGSSVGNDFIYTWERNGEIVDGATSFSLFNVGEPGDYTLIVTNANNDCVSSDMVTITADVTPPVVAAAATDNLDCVTFEVDLDGTGSDQGMNMSYAWTNADQSTITGPADQPNTTVNASSFYFLEVTNNDNGCSAIDSVFVEIDETAPVVDITQPDPIICSQETQTLQTDVNTTNGNIDYSWAGPGIVSGADSGAPVVDAGGMYTLTVTDPDNGCTTSENISVNDDRELPTADAGPNALINCFTPTAELDASASSGLGELIYTWTTSNGTFDTATDIVNPTVSGPGQYTLTILDTANDCAQTTTVEVVDDFTEPVANAGNDTQLDCGTESLVLDGSGSSAGNFSYTWTATNGGAIAPGDESAQSPEIIAAGTYQVVVMNLDNGCTSTDEVIVNNDASAPVLNIAATANGVITCNDEVLTLNASVDNTNDYDFVWTIENGEGNISAGQNTLSPTVDQPGTYTLTVINNINNCETPFSIAITEATEDPAIDLNVANIIDCNNGTTEISTLGSDAGDNFTYTWTTDNGEVIPMNTENPVVDAQGSYTLTITNNATGCVSAMTVPVAEDFVEPMVSADATEIITCTNPDVPLVGTGSSTGATYTYEWLNADNEVVGTELNIETDTPGNYTLIVTNNQNGCTSSMQTTVDIDADFPAVEAGSAEVLTCLVLETDLNGAGSATGSNITYQWTVINGSGNISDATSLVTSINGPGTYQLTVTNSDNDCVASDEVVVTEDLSVPTLSIADPEVITCLVEEVTLTVSSPDGGNYTWVGAGNISNPESATPVVNASGSYTVSATHNVTGCESSASVMVTEDIVLPEVNPGSDYLISCETGNAILSGSTNVSNPSFVWTDENGNTYTGANIAAEVPGTYILTVTDLDNACIDFAETFVETQFPTDIAATETDVDCISGYGRIQIEGVTGGTPGYTFSIDGGDTFSPSTLLTQLDAGIYTVLVQDENGCEYEEEFEILPEQTLIVDLEPIVRLNLGDSYQFNPLINKSEDILESISWTPADSLSCGDCLQPEITPLESARYFLNLRDSLGCTAEASSLIILNKEARVYIPSAFSPDGNGDNEVFMIYADPASVQEVVSFEVYNRWGEAVHSFFSFPPNDPLFGWNGTHREQALDPGVFAYVAQIKMSDGRIEVFKGDVTLFK